MAALRAVDPADPTIPEWGKLNLRSIIGTAIAAGIFLLLGQPDATAGGDQGPQLAAMCASCHRLDVGGKDFPRIIGLGEEKFAAAPLAYRASESPTHIMHAVALLLSNQEIANISRYLAGQRASNAP